MLSAWTPNDICEQILKLANKGITPSQIRMILQNSCDFRPVKDITVNKILRILKLNGRHLNFFFSNNKEKETLIIE